MHVRRTLSALGVVVALAIAVAPPVEAPTTWLVGLADGAQPGDLDAGSLTRYFPDLDTGVVRATTAEVELLRADSDVLWLAPDAELLPTSDDDDAGDDADTTSAERPDRSAADELGAAGAWAAGITGAGVGVALIDTGVADHPDLAGRVVQGFDFSGDGDFVDRFGHGTAMAGLIAGDGHASGGRFRGAAPGATIVSVKVAGADGSTDVSQVLAAIQWVVSFRDQHDIEVLALAYGNDSQQSAKTDPLAYAVQRAHEAGLVVVTSAGNLGHLGAGSVTSPGTAPAGLTVGAHDPATDAMAAFTGFGQTVDGLSKPDVLAPGVDLVAPVAAGSTIAASYPEALREDGTYIRGSGSSQAVGVAAGFAALLRQAAGQGESGAQTHSRMLASAQPTSDGRTVIDVAAIDVKRRFAPFRTRLRSDGLGSLEAARGSVHVTVDGQELTGEVTVLGEQWNGSSWTGSSWTGSSWTGSSWTGSSWTGSSWTGSSWTGSSWTGSSWTGSSWTGSSWTGSSWTSSIWTATMWD